MLKRWYELPPPLGCQIIIFHTLLLKLYYAHLLLLLASDLLHSLPWGWINRREDPSVKATIYLMLSFSSRYYCTIWEEIRAGCEMGRVSWKSCCSDEWHSPNTLYPRAHEDFDRLEGSKLEGSLEHHPKVITLAILRMRVVFFSTIIYGAAGVHFVWNEVSICHRHLGILVVGHISLASFPSLINVYHLDTFVLMINKLQFWRFFYEISVWFAYLMHLVHLD